MAERFKYLPPDIPPARTMQECADAMGVSKRRAEQIHDRAMTKLRETLALPEYQQLAAALAGELEPPRPLCRTGRRNRKRITRTEAIR